MIVQIYEIQTPEEARRCIDLGVDQIGSVLLSQPDWQQQSIKDVISVCHGTPVRNSLIPLFRDRDTLYRAAEFYRPHFIHFCESLTDHAGRKPDLEEFIELQEGMKNTFPEIGIMRSIPIPPKGVLPGFPSLDMARELEAVTDIFLTDTYLGKEPVEGYIGITGKRVDPEMALQLVLQSQIPVILAGGLSPENVYGAIMEVLPAGADSCTLTNRVDSEGRPIRFHKDFSKVDRFVSEVRRAEEALRLKREELQAKMAQQREELREREEALPAHSVKPHQLLAIEELEEAISLVEKELGAIDKALSENP